VVLVDPDAIEAPTEALCAVMEADPAEDEPEVLELDVEAARAAASAEVDAAEARAVEIAVVVSTVLLAEPEMELVTPVFAEPVPLTVAVADVSASAVVAEEALPLPEFDATVEGTRIVTSIVAFLVKPVAPTVKIVCSKPEVSAAAVTVRVKVTEAEPPKVLFWVAKVKTVDASLVTKTV